MSPKRWPAAPRTSGCRKRSRTCTACSSNRSFRNRTSGGRELRDRCMEGSESEQRIERQGPFQHLAKLLGTCCQHSMVGCPLLIQEGWLAHQQMGEPGWSEMPKRYVSRAPRPPPAQLRHETGGYGFFDDKNNGK